MGNLLAGVQQMVPRLNGGSMLGGPPRVVWHTFETWYERHTAESGARYLVSSGHEVHFVFHPITGDVVQLLPANIAGRGLKNLPGGVQTNRMGTVCLQVEVIGWAAKPWTADLTPAGKIGLGKIIRFARAHGIPDVWPAGPPRGAGAVGTRSTVTWSTRAGHYGHGQVPENDHWDPGEITVAALWAAAAGLPRTAPLWPLPNGWYFGPEDGPQESVSGYHGHQDDLALWQRAARELGLGITADGLYGPRTAMAAEIVQSWARSRGLRPTGLPTSGLIDVNTWDATWTMILHRTEREAVSDMLIVRTPANGDYLVTPIGREPIDSDFADRLHAAGLPLVWLTAGDITTLAAKIKSITSDSTLGWAT